MNKPLVSIVVPTHNRTDMVQRAISSLLNQTYQNIEIFVCDNSSSDNTQEVLKSYEDKRIVVLKNDPTISVVIPAYKAERFIKRTIDSVLIQQDVEVEIIVIEDGVFDNTREVLKEYEDKLILITLKENKGAQYARNKGLELSKNEFIMFLDADDYFEGEDFLRGLHDSMVSNDSDIVFGKSIKKWENGKEQVLFSASKDESKEDTIIRWIIGRAGPSPCSILWKKSSVQKIGGWNPLYTKNQDGEIVLRAILKDLKLSLSQKGAGIYWQYEGERISKRINNQAFECQERLYYDVKKEIRGIPEEKEILCALNYYIAGAISRAMDAENKEYEKKFYTLWDRTLPKLKLIKQHSIRMYITHFLYFIIGIKLTRKLINGIKKVSL